MKNKGSGLQTASKKKQFIIFGLCSFLALCICLVTLVVTVERLDNGNGAQQTEDIYAGKTLLENEKAEVCEYIYNATLKTQSNEFIKVNTYTDVYVDDGAILVDGKGDSADARLLAYAKGKLLSTVDGYYGEDYTGVFGTVYNKMPLINLGSCDAALCNVTVGQADENGEPVYDDNGELVDKEYYFFTISVDDVALLGDEFKGSFNADELPDVMGEFTRDVADYCSLSDTQVTAQGYVIRAKVNILTDEISYIEIERAYSVKAGATFLNELDAFGEKSVELEYRVINKYEYAYAGITLSADELILEKGEESVLNVNAIIEDDSEYTVTFASSDESKATVDEMGYVYAVAYTDEPVYITVTLEYLGESFTDTCAVYIEPQKE